MALDRSEALRLFDNLDADGQQAALVFLQLLSGKMPADRLTVLAANRHAIRIQKKGREIPAGLMPMLSSLAMQIIYAVPDLDARRILMRHYWHAESVELDKVEAALHRAGLIT